MDTTHHCGVGMTTLLWILHCVHNYNTFLSFPNLSGIHKFLIAMYKSYYVYILASKRNGTLYTGVTNNLERRIYEHKNSIIKGFTKRYKVHNLVYFEETNDVNEALLLEKRIKKWNRTWKINLIEKDNPKWQDLAGDWY